jgi:hypothetical protein
MSSCQRKKQTHFNKRGKNEESIFFKQFLTATLHSLALPFVRDALHAVQRERERAKLEEDIEVIVVEKERERKRERGRDSKKMGDALHAVERGGREGVSKKRMGRPGCSPCGTYRGMK